MGPGDGVNPVGTVKGLLAGSAVGATPVGSLGMGTMPPFSTPVASLGEGTAPPGSVAFPNPTPVASLGEGTTPPGSVVLIVATGGGPCGTLCVCCAIIGRGGVTPLVISDVGGGVKCGSELVTWTTFGICEFTECLEAVDARAEVSDV